MYAKFFKISIWVHAIKQCAQITIILIFYHIDKNKQVVLCPTILNLSPYIARKDPPSMASPSKTFTIYLSSYSLKLTCEPTYLYAGRIIFPALMISSRRCALHPAIREIAKIGVNNSSGIPSIVYTNPL